MAGRKWLHVVLGVALGAFLVWFLFRGTDWRAVWGSIRRVRLGWILLGQALIWVTFFTRIQRWSYIVRAGDSASFRHMFSATQIGFLGNFTLPGRIGEVVRAVVLSRLTRISFSKSLAMVALDRVTDLIGLVAVMLVSVIAFRPAKDIVLPPQLYANPIPADLIRTGAMGAAVFLLAVVGALVMLYTNQKLVLRLSDKCLGLLSARLARGVHGLLEQFAEGLHVFRSASDMTKSIFFSLVTWALFVLIYAAIMSAFRLSYPWYAPFVVTSAVAVVLAAPGSPGFVGQFHLGLIIGAAISVPGLSVNDAKAMAILTHILTLIPIVIAGVFCLVWEDLRIASLFRISSGDEGDRDRHGTDTIR